MIDFTSALYLGLPHPSAGLSPWRALTTGAPAALVEPVEARETALALARLLGGAAAVLAPSTFHAMWDVFGVLAQQRITVHMDAGAYPISRWGSARAALRGRAVREFAHHDPAALRRALGRDAPGCVPVVVTDGFCPACGRPAPLADYLACARARGGMLLVDDTQALGILGRDPTREMPYGRDGGGSLRWHALHGPDVIVVASLAKAFGVPVALVAGSAETIAGLKRDGDTRVHCSPPSFATLAAARHALAANRASGDLRRAALLQRVRQFRRGLEARGLAATGGIFPAQTIAASDDTSATACQEQLERRGVRALLVRGEDGRPRLGFLITASHSAPQIDVAVQAIGEVLDRGADIAPAHPVAEARPAGARFSAIHYPN